MADSAKYNQFSTSYRNSNYKKSIKSLLTKEFLQEKLILGSSYNEIGKEVGCQADTVRKYCNEFGLKSWQTDQNLKGKELRKEPHLTIKIKQNLIDKYSIGPHLVYKAIKERRLHTNWRQYPNFTRRQREIIFGTLLGDSWLTHRVGNKNCKLLFGQSIQHQEYFDWMCKELGSHISSVFKIPATQHYNSSEQTRFQTVNHPYLTTLYKELYFFKIKNPSEEYLKRLTPLSLATWIMDDGSLCVTKKRSCSLHLCTHGFTLETNQLISRVLNDLFGLKSIVSNCRLNSKLYYYLRFPLEETKKLSKLVKPHMCNSMLYKIDLNRYYENREKLSV